MRVNMPRCCIYHNAIRVILKVQPAHIRHSLETAERNEQHPTSRSRLERNLGDTLRRNLSLKQFVRLAITDSDPQLYCVSSCSRLCFCVHCADSRYGCQTTQAASPEIQLDTEPTTRRST